MKATHRVGLQHGVPTLLILERLMARTPPIGSPFKPGQSGNPGGRSKALVAAEALAREHTDTAIRTLVEICKDKRAPGAARVSAASVLLDRGHGKARQTVDLNANVTDLPDDALQHRIAERLAELLAAGPGAAGTDGGGGSTEDAPGSEDVVH